MHPIRIHPHGRPSGELVLEQRDPGRSCAGEAGASSSWPYMGIFAPVLQLPAAPSPKRGRELAASA